jgi:tRNA-modifying protein YgfZ
MLAMNANWQQWLQSGGAHIEGGVVRNFGDSQGELEATLSQSALADLSHLGVLDFIGEDSEAFLQGQFSCDVRSLQAGSTSYGGYCTPKGRLLADFLLWRVAGGFRMALSRGILAPVQKRLKMYVLRSKVQISDASEALVLLGASGPAAADALRASGIEPPQRSHELAHFGADDSVISLAGQRYVLVVPPERAAVLWTSLAARLRPVGTPCWEWLDIHNGVPLITARTQEQFVPQMVNLELIGGVSFSKGCYPGQEIVARTHYLGKVKRRMFLAHLEADAAPAPGDDIYSDDIPGQTSGMVVNAQAAPGGGYDLLAVAQLSSGQSPAVRLKSPQGPALRFLELPYEVT